MTGSLNNGTGAVNVSGTLNIGDSSRLNGTGTITVNSGGTLAFTGTTGADRIRDTAPMNLNGGTLSTNGFSEHGATNNTAGIGALTLSASSIIDLGSGSSVVAFANSSAQTWTGTLSIYNWSGSTAGGGTDQLYFGNDNTGLNTGQLGQVTFYSDSGTTALGVAQILMDGEIVPVPEPATWFAASLTVIAVAGTSYRRYRYCRALVAP